MLPRKYVNRQKVAYGAYRGRDIVKPLGIADFGELQCKTEIKGKW